MMKYFFLLLSILCTLCITEAAAPKESAYAVLSKNMVNNIINLNEDTYTKYFLQQTRDFDAFLLYTTVGNRFSCKLCPATNREYGMVAKAYNAIKEKGDKRVLFVRIAIDNNQRIFQYHDFKTAPIITYLPANEVMEKKLNPVHEYNLDYPVRAENIASFVRSKIQLTMEIYRFPWPQVIILSIFVFGLPLAAYIYLFKNEQVYNMLGNYKIYLIAALAVYCVAVTGFAYDIINGPTLLDCDHSGCSIFLRRGQNQQTIAEGLVTGGLCITCAVLIVLMLEKTKNKGEDVDGKIEKYCTLFVICMLVYLFCFCIRTPWYYSVFFYRG